MDLQGVPAAMRSALDEEEAAEAAARAHRSMADAVVLGRGYNYATALEWALKLKEMAYVRAQGYSTADFQHGPAASLPADGQVLAVSAQGPMRDELTEVLSNLQGERRARVLLATDDPPDAGTGATVLPFPASLPEWLSPLAAIVPIQLFCYHLAREKGLDVESPRGLHKVTLTR
jgi:glucosamine--fructose-6-phosphate aminotransferase (isomerizing)